ncbi:MAG TPA: hypothetical protein EYQ14_17755 [Gammaproteobacteria bacterium]|nr:hypothetical protein [Gammaproteobacteria bacterium]HIL96400.1 hypothetical protein [Pseudomonadales bacterium]
MLMATSSTTTSPRNSIGCLPEKHRLRSLNNAGTLVNRLGIIVNPMSGRDVRRVAAKASISAHHDKQQQLTRLVLGALAHGVDEIYLANEPFRINVGAVENLPDRNKVKILDFPLTHSDKDTALVTTKMWDEGCRVFIVLGGDGTNRIVAKTRPDAIVLPLSTGTNNVFPLLMEASVAGAAAGLIASKRLKFENHCLRCKQLHISINGAIKDVAMIDAVLLKDDALGSLLPFAPEKLSQLFLTRADPASVGMSPIGGYLIPCSAEDNFGVRISCDQIEQNQSVRVPISPGLYGDVPISDVEKMEIGQTYQCQAPGILAFDGDRSIAVTEDDLVEITIRRDGPWIIDPAKIMLIAAQHGLLVSPVASSPSR